MPAFKRIIWPFFTVIVLIFIPLFGQSDSSHYPMQAQLTFSYTHEELDYLKQLPVNDSKITVEDLDQINQELSYILDTKKINELDLTLIPAYLAVAQKDFAWISYLISKDFVGNLAPVTLWTLQLFLPDISLYTATEAVFDVYTASIAALVIKKVAERFASEKKQLKDYQIKKEKGLWTPTSPGYSGLMLGSAKTWFLKNSHEFLADEPPQNEDIWKKQCSAIMNVQKNLNDENVHSVYEWAGMTSYNAGSWDAMLTDYFKTKNVPLVPQLYIRSLLKMAILDANAAVHHSKYTYWVMRPSQRECGVKLMITIPNHPSYPSAHSTIAGTASVLLSEFFPEDSEKWNKMADEAGMSRIRAGIHYPIDHEQGLKLGKKIGQTVLERTRKKGNSSDDQEATLKKVR